MELSTKHIARALRELAHQLENSPINTFDSRTADWGPEDGLRGNVLLEQKSASGRSLGRNEHISEGEFRLVVDVITPRPTVERAETVQEIFARLGGRSMRTFDVGGDSFNSYAFDLSNDLSIFVREDGQEALICAGITTLVVGAKDVPVAIRLAELASWDKHSRHRADQIRYAPPCDCEEDGNDHQLSEEDMVDAGFVKASPPGSISRSNLWLGKIGEEISVIVEDGVGISLVVDKSCVTIGSGALESVVHLVRVANS